jgi:hypothetical protein
MSLLIFDKAKRSSSERLLRLQSGVEWSFRKPSGLVFGYPRVLRRATRESLMASINFGSDPRVAACLQKGQASVARCVPTRFINVQSPWTRGCRMDSALISEPLNWVIITSWIPSLPFECRGSFTSSFRPLLNVESSRIEPSKLRFEPVCFHVA